MDDAGLLRRLRRVPSLLPDLPFQHTRRKQAISELPAGCGSIWLLRAAVDACGARSRGAVFGGHHDLAWSCRSTASASQARLVDVSDLAVRLGHWRCCFPAAVPDLPADWLAPYTRH